MEKVCFGLITGAVKPAANISPEKAGIEQNEKRKPKLTLSLLQKEKSHNIWPKNSCCIYRIFYKHKLRERWESGGWVRQFV